MEFRVIYFYFFVGMHNLYCDGSFKRHAIPAALKGAAQLRAIFNSTV